MLPQVINAKPPDRAGRSPSAMPARWQTVNVRVEQASNLLSVPPHDVDMLQGVHR